MTTTPLITLRSGPDLLAAVPYLVGHRLTDTVAVLLYGGAPGQVHVATAPIDADPERLAERITATIDRLGATEVAVAAYGPQPTRPRLGAFVAHLSGHALVRAAFLADSGRSYCLTCPCPEATDGVEFDPQATAAACEATVAGLVASPTPATPEGLAAPDPVLQARTAAALAHTVMPDDPAVAMRYLLDGAADGLTLTDDQAARIAVLLTDHAARDLALHGVSDARWQRDLWLHLTRRLPDAYLRPAGILAALCAWTRDETALALAVAHRVHQVFPADPIARGLITAIAAGASVTDVVGTWPPTDTTGTTGPEVSL
ncbi:DUF4192 domain-containing protein [Longispora sp. NPDC051575]|uniref:DUF4192 domain-containing protein n=1 Tax=Longispora sp. NPDC051575 TaxID=3154943 RepID=UPI003443B23A